MDSVRSIKLPRDHVPIFPDRCVGCGRGSLTKRKVKTHTVGVLSVATFHQGDRFTIAIPCCRACSMRMRSRMATGIVFFVPLAMVFGWLALIVSHQYHLGSWAKRGVIALFLAVSTLPLILWHIFLPPPFDVTAFVESVDYDFRDLSYAVEFAKLNAGQLISVS
jgi:hypothetical protein